MGRDWEGRESYYQNKRKDCFREGYFPLVMWEGRGEGSGLITQMPQLPLGHEEGPMIDRLIETKQKILD